ncbi:MAG: FkbM family methyltransferase [Deltaproteobacteria bacterium]
MTQGRLKPWQRRRALWSDRIKLLQQMLSPSRQLRVVDIGANPIHVPPYDMLLELGGCEVIGFEPLPAAYEALLKQPQQNRRFINAAVGPAGAAILNVYPASGFTSLYKLSAKSVQYLTAPSALRQVGNETEHSVTLRPLDELGEVTMIDLLKIDVQGAERDIIAGGRAKLANAICVIPELRYHRLYVDEPLMGDLDCELRAQGFTLHKFMPTGSMHLQNSQSARPAIAAISNQLVDGDAVYIRNLEDADAWSDDQLAFLAIAANGIFNSADLCLRALDHLVARKAIPASTPEAYAMTFLASRDDRETPLDDAEAVKSAVLEGKLETPFDEAEGQAE